MELRRSAAADAPAACAFLLPVQSLSGDAVAVRVHDDMLGRGLERLVTQAVLPKAGANVRVQHGLGVLALGKTLQETADSAGLFYAQVRANLAQASRCVMQIHCDSAGSVRLSCSLRLGWEKHELKGVEMRRKR